MRSHYHLKAGATLGDMVVQVYDSMLKRSNSPDVVSMKVAHVLRRRLGSNSRLLDLLFAG